MSPQRLIHRAFWLRHIPLALALIAAASFCGGALWVRGNDINQTNHHQCVLINRLDDAIVTTLERSRKGLPANSYYRTHPRELRAALRSVDRSIARFRAARC